MRCPQISKERNTVASSLSFSGGHSLTEGPRFESYVTVPPLLLLATNSLSTSVRTLRKVDGQGSTTRITLERHWFLRTFLSRSEESPLSGSRHSPWSPHKSDFYRVQKRDG